MIANTIGKMRYVGSADSKITGNFGTRALKAYWRSAEDGETLPTPREAELYEKDSRWYVVLSGNSKIYAVYKIQTNDTLRRLKRHPSELVEMIEG